MVDIGVKAFLPSSQIDLHPVRDLDSPGREDLPPQDHQDQPSPRQRGRVATRAVGRDARSAPSDHPVHAEGRQLIQGTVKNITDYGAFIDLGGIDGLLHITDMSWGRVGHPSELFQVSDKVVTVLKV